MLISPHLIGAGMGGQFAHWPSSNCVDRSRFSRKKGTTSVVPALVTVLLPQVLKVFDASAAAGVSGAGAFGCDARFAIVLISEWKWFSKLAWNPSMMRKSSVESRDCGLGWTESRYLLNSARPGRKDSANSCC